MPARRGTRSRSRTATRKSPTSRCWSIVHSNVGLHARDDGDLRRVVRPRSGDRASVRTVRSTRRSVARGSTGCTPRTTGGAPVRRLHQVGRSARLARRGARIDPARVADRVRRAVWADVRHLRRRPARAASRCAARRSPTSARSSRRRAPPVSVARRSRARRSRCLRGAKHPVIMPGRVGAQPRGVERAHRARRSAAAARSSPICACRRGVPDRAPAARRAQPARQRRRSAALREADAILSLDSVDLGGMLRAGVRRRTGARDGRSRARSTATSTTAGAWTTIAAAGRSRHRRRRRTVRVARCLAALGATVTARRGRSQRRARPAGAGDRRAERSTCPRSRRR